MAQFKTVTISTDGQRDYVALPDGLKLMLGIVPMAKLVGTCAPSRTVARRALDEFLAHGQAVLPLDLDRMEPLFAPKRTRWAFAIPLVTGKDRTTTTESMHMADTVTRLDHQVGLIEQQVSQISKLAAAKLPTTEAVDGLRRLTANLHFKDYGDQSKNDAAMGLGAPKVDTVDGTQPPVPKELTNPKVASEEAQPSLQVLAENAALADTVIQQVAQTDKTIDLLVTAGRKFNASKAKADLYKVANGVTEILQQVDLAQPYVKADLVKLAQESARIHGLFSTAKV